jgi:hypothetical protein
MTRDIAFWTIIGVTLIPIAWLGWLRGRAIGRAYQAIYSDLRKSGIELSKTDLQVLIGQLNRNPKTVLDTESRPESRSIKEPHIHSLVTYLKAIRRYIWLLVVMGAVAVLFFHNFWPKP